MRFFSSVYKGYSLSMHEEGSDVREFELQMTVVLLETRYGIRNGIESRGSTYLLR